jgi:hypothetical protein
MGAAACAWRLGARLCVVRTEADRLGPGVAYGPTGVDAVRVALEVCDHCSKPIRVQIFSGTGYCSENCRKELVACLNLLEVKIISGGYVTTDLEAEAARTRNTMMEQ